MKVYKTKKLFFGKWLYKLETYTPGANLIKSWGLADVEKFCKDANDNRYQRSYNNVDKKQLLEYLEAVTPFFDKDLQTRAEWSTLNFFLNDPDLFQELADALDGWVVSMTKPGSEEDIHALLSNASYVLCDALPYGMYQYKIYMRSGMPALHKSKFLEWLGHYPDKVRISRSTEKWLNHDHHYLQDPFIYITDKNQLLMTQLHLGNWLRSTDEYVLRNTQNSVK